MVSPGRQRLVVADDHPGMLAAATAVLQTRFDVVAAVTSGRAAVDAALQLDPDVVVLDVAMPVLNGLQAASLLRGAGSRAKIVVLSSYGDDDTVLAAIRSGAAAFVAKPRMVVDLIAAVDHVLAGRRFLPSYRLARACWDGGHHHDLQLYETDAHLIAVIGDVFAGAISAGDSVVAIVSAAHAAALGDHLRSGAVDGAALRHAGRFQVLDSHEALESILRDGVPDAALFARVLDPVLETALAAATIVPPHVTMYGEIAPILCAGDDFEAMDRLEDIAAEYAASRGLALLCGYSMACVRRAGPDILQKVCAHHSVVAPAEL